MWHCDPQSKTMELLSNSWSEEMTEGGRLLATGLAGRDLLSLAKPFQLKKLNPNPKMIF